MNDFINGYLDFRIIIISYVFKLYEPQQIYIRRSIIIAYFIVCSCRVQDGKERKKNVFVYYSFVC